MRSVKCMVIAAVLACTMAAYGQSVIVYSVETGGNNHAADWENNDGVSPVPAYTSGVTDGSTVVNAGDDLNWAVRVSVGGTHSGAPGDGLPPFGAANLVFDLAVVDASGAPVNLGAAPMTCTTGTPGSADALGCKPTDKGFYSTINDGDGDGIHGAAVRDIWANAAFAIAIYNTEPAPAQLRALSDDVPDGPNFDYGWYPTANGRGGIDIDGTKPVNTSVNKPELAGKLVGFGAGYKNYNYTSYRPGVGLYEIDWGVYGFGANIGGDPEHPTAAERPLFEGQLCTKGLAAGTYYLKVIPSANGNNILHGSVNWQSPTGDYSGFGSFAAKANSAVALPAQVSGVKFVVTGVVPTPSTMASRNVFYNNSYYDNNNVNIDAGTGAKTDTAAIDTTKSPLMAGAGAATFANWTGYTKGINGLIYDVNVGDNQRDPLASDFTFNNVGKTGAVAPAAISPAASSMIVLNAASPRKVRMVFTFADTTVLNTWVKVDIGTGFGLATAETHYWGNAAGDTNTGNTSPNIFVNVQDEVAVRGHPTTALNRSPVTDKYDVNKTSLVDPADQVYVRSHTTTTLNAVKMISK